MDDDDLDDDIETSAPVIKKKEPGVSHRIDDLPQGKQDCYWCGKVFDASVMQRSRIHNTVIYICRDCGQP